MVKEKEQTTETPKKKAKIVPIIIVLIGIIIVLGLIGNFIYKKIAERAAEGILSGITGGNVNLSGDKVSIKTEDGELAFEEGGKIPDTFPNDFPVYPGAKVASSFTSTGDNNSKGVSVLWETGDSLEKVGKFFETELAENGWKITANFSSEDSITFTIEKGETGGVVGITPQDDKTAISVTLGVK